MSLPLILLIVIILWLIGGFALHIAQLIIWIVVVALIVWLLLSYFGRTPRA